MAAGALWAKERAKMTLPWVRLAAAMIMVASACSPKSVALSDGGWTVPPAGWTAYCAREGQAAGDPSC